MKKTFHIQNISCRHCVMTIQNELSENENILSVLGDAEKKEVTVEWQSPASEEQIRSLLKEINYPAE